MPDLPGPIRTTESVNFSIDSPAPSSTATANGAGMITVMMNDNGSPDDFAASIYLFTPGSPLGAQQGGPTNFPAHGSSNERSVLVSVGPIAPSPPSQNNRIVQVEDLDSGTLIGQPFRVVPSGSGSSGTGRALLAVKFCGAGQLVPVALMLKLDGELANGTAARCNELNRPTLLLHARDAAFANFWVSRPIAFDGKGVPEGYWILERSSATAWTLLLKQGVKVLVTFLATTEPRNCSLPITLQRKGAGSRVCKNWPKTVTVSPA